MSKTQDIDNNRKRIKIALVKAFGDHCQLCGKSYPNSVYEFHHLNPDDKEFNLGSSSTTRSRESYVNEANKCCMLCANCHRLVEYEIDDVILVANFNESIYWGTLHSLIKTQNTQKSKKEKRTYPSKEELYAKLIQYNGNFCKTARDYGVSDNAIRKWCKKLNLPSHSSDYKKL